MLSARTLDLSSLEQTRRRFEFLPTNPKLLHFDSVQVPSAGFETPQADMQGTVRRPESVNVLGSVLVRALQLLEQSGLRQQVQRRWRWRWPRLRSRLRQTHG